MPYDQDVALEAGDQDKQTFLIRPEGRFQEELSRGVRVQHIRCSPIQPGRVETRAGFAEKRLDKRRTSPKVGCKGRS